MNKPVAITGASGFVGGYLANALVTQAYPVRILVRDGARVAALQRAGAQVVVGDLADETALRSFVHGAASVIHCAGAIAARSRAEFERVNVAGTAALARAARLERVPRFVHVSSLAARAPELSDYAASKLGSEEALRAEASGGLSYVILRPPAVYGQGDRATLPLFAQLVRRHAFLPGRADQRISLIHVSDLAEALATLAFARAPSGSVHELHDGTAGGYSWESLARIAGAVEGHAVGLTLLPRPLVWAVARINALMGRLAGRAVMLTPGKVNELYHPDWAAHHMLLDHHSDWRAAFDFETGFRQTVDWYRAQGWLPGSPRTGTSQPARKHGETAR